MSLGIFRRKFVIRRFGEESMVMGCGVAPFSDVVASLNVQPLSKDELKALPEGEHRVKRMKAYGDMVLNPADQSTGKRGDWLFYQGNMDPEGHWYECVSSIGWDHTMLHHCKSEFILVSESEASRVPLPTTIAERGEGGDDREGI